MEGLKYICHGQYQKKSQTKVMRKVLIKDFREFESLANNLEYKIIMLRIKCCNLNSRYYTGVSLLLLFGCFPSAV